MVEMNITPTTEFPVLRLVHMTFHASTALEFLDLFAAHQPAISAATGCGGVVLVAREVENGVGFSTVSRWRSTEALDAYRASPLFGVVWPATKRLFACPPVAESFTRRL